MTRWEFYMLMWNERDHYSQISGAYLGEEPQAYMFSHLVSKGSHPELERAKENVWFMTFEEHRDWEDGRTDHPKWGDAKKQVEWLKQKENQKNLIIYE